METKYCECGCGTLIQKYGLSRGKPTKSKLRRYVIGHQAIKPHPELKKIPCACGCGELILNFNKERDKIRWDRPKKYMQGHVNKSVEGKKRLSESQKGDKNSFYNLKHSEDTKKYLKELVDGKSFVERFGKEKAKEIGEKISKKKKGQPSKLKNRTYEEMMGIEKAKKLKKVRAEILIKAISGVKRSRISRQRQSVSMIEKWKDEEYRKKTIKNILKNLHKRPTNYEKKISEICIENNLPFIYVGNGNFLIGNKNPDFINKEKRIAIEVFNNYHKILSFGSVEKYIQDRTEYFRKYGYEIIFIGEEIMEDMNWKKICLDKIEKRYEEIIKKI